MHYFQNSTNLDYEVLGEAQQYQVRLTITIHSDCKVWKLF